MFAILRLSDFAGQYLDAMCGKLSPVVYNSYQKVIENTVLPALGHHKIAEIRPVHVQEFVKILSAICRTAYGQLVVKEVHIGEFQAYQFTLTRSREDLNAYICGQTGVYFVKSCGHPPFDTSKASTAGNTCCFISSFRSSTHEELRATVLTLLLFEF